MSKTILVVDDTESLRTLVKSYLSQEGFRVVTAGDGRQALFLARDEKPDLILLDLMMPEMGGYEFMRVYGREAETPTIILTAKVEENDKVLGLELGADDYVTKPFSVRELIARVKAVLRRVHTGGASDDSPEIITVAGITVDRNKRRVTLEGTHVELTAKEFDLLVLFATNPGRVFNRNELLDKVWGYQFEGYGHTVNSHINRLRAKIEKNPAEPRYIMTVWGVGYKFVDVEADAEVET